VDEILWCYHPTKGTEQYFLLVLWCCLLCYKNKVVLTFEALGEILNFARSNESRSQVAINTLLLRSFKLTKVVLTFESVDEIVNFDCSNESSSQTVLSCCAVYCVVQGGSNF